MKIHGACSFSNFTVDHLGQHRTSVKLFELGVRTPRGLFLGVLYAGSVDFRRFRTPSLPIIDVILGPIEAMIIVRKSLYSLLSD